MANSNYTTESVLRSEARRDLRRARQQARIHAMGLRLGLTLGAYGGFYVLCDSDAGDLIVLGPATLSKIERFLEARCDLFS